MTSLEIPESVTNIGAGAFSGCGGLTNLVIPEGVTTIEHDVCRCCSKLTSVKMPESVTTIEYQAFDECDSLTNVYIPCNVIEIGSEAFGDCDKLTSIKIPGSIIRMGEGAFGYCYKLTDIYYGGSKKQWDKIRQWGSGDTITNEFLHIMYFVTIHYCSDEIDNGESQEPDPGTTSPDSSTQLTDSNTQTPEQANIALSSSNVQLSKSSVTYNGKAQKPSVIVKNNDGSRIEPVNYTVSYANNKNVGQAAVTVRFSGNYQGTVKKTFNIIPKGTTISKVTAKKKGLSVKWKKQTTQTTGYEIQYSTNSNFKGAKKAGNIKAKTTSKSISKLKAKKKYYVRIRTYKTVKGKKYYSNWSKSKSVITKK